MPAVRAVKIIVLVRGSPDVILHVLTDNASFTDTLTLQSQEPAFMDMPIHDDLRVRQIHGLPVGLDNALRDRPSATRTVEVFQVDTLGLCLSDLEQEAHPSTIFAGIDLRPGFCV